MKKGLKVCIIILSSLLGLIFLIVAGTAFVFRNEISIYSTIKQLRPANRDVLQGGVYEITYKGNYYFEDFIKAGGAKTDKEITDFLNKKFTKGLVNMNIYTGTFGCSAFTAITKDGQNLLARNYDYPATNTCIVKVKGNRKRHASISTVDLSFLGIPYTKDMDSFVTKVFSITAVYCPLDGLNDAGVSCGVLVSGQGPGTGSIPTKQNTDKPDITTSTFIRMILDYADSLEDAVEIAQNYDMHDSGRSSYHCMVADKTGRSAILEWVNEVDKTDINGEKRKLIVTYNDSDFQAVTNFIIVPGYFEGTEEKFIDGKDRYDIICDALSPSNGIIQDEMKAMDILYSVAHRTIDPKHSKINKHLTVHSVIFNLDEGIAIWCFAEQFQDNESKIRLSLTTER